MSITRHLGGSPTITGTSINLYRLMVLRSGLKLEMRGIKMHRGATAYSIIQREFNLKGSRESVLRQFEALIEEVKAAQAGGTQ